MAHSRQLISAVLASGGIESTVLIDLVRHRRYRAIPLYIRSGYIWETTEIYHLKQLLKSLGGRLLRDLVILKAPLYSDYPHPHWSLTGNHPPSVRSDASAVFLEGRNLHLIAQASIYCSLNRIPSLHIGVLKTNPFRDGNRHYFSLFQRVLNQSMKAPPLIKTPFLQKTKKEVLQIGSHLPLHLTWSCLSPYKKCHCGRCNKCAERQDGFKVAGLPDKTKYRDS